MPVLTTNTIEGFAFTIDVNLDGTTTVANFSGQTTVAPAPAIPEPSTLSLMAVGVGLWLAFGSGRASGDLQIIASAARVIGRADHDPDRRVDEITKIGSLDAMTAAAMPFPGATHIFGCRANKSDKGDRRPHVHAGPEHRIAVVLRHHQQRLDAAHGTRRTALCGARSVRRTRPRANPTHII
jgi:hypothetical protein